MSSPDRRHPADPDPAARPRSLAQRLQLLLILLVLPVAAVTLPTLAVTGIFGRQPKPKPTVHAKPAPTPVRATPTPDASGLKAALDYSAEKLLPAPAPLSPDPIQVAVRADHLDARAKKVIIQAHLLGGSTTEGIATPGEKHLFVELPAGSSAAFRQAVLANEAPFRSTDTPALGGARDQVEVVIRSSADDE